MGLDQVGITYSPNETIGDWHRTPTNDRGNIYFNGVLWSSQTSQENDQTSTNEDYQTAYTTTAIDNAFNKIRQNDENDNLWHSVELSKILGSDSNSAVNFCDTNIQGTWNKQNDSYFSLKGFIDNFPENEITNKQLFQLCVAMVGATQPVYETLKYEIEHMLDNNEL